MTLPNERLESLRQHRTRPERDLSVGAVISRISERADRVHRRLGDLITIWNDLVPDDLARRTTITGMRGGIVHVQVDSAAAGYELDRLLREGLLEKLRARSRATLRRVRVKVGESTHA